MKVKYYCCEEKFLRLLFESAFCGSLLFLLLFSPITPFSLIIPLCPFLCSYYLSFTPSHHSCTLLPAPSFPDLFSLYFFRYISLYISLTLQLSSFLPFLPLSYSVFSLPLFPFLYLPFSPHQFFCTLNIHVILFLF